MPRLQLTILLSLAIYRVTRLIVSDTIFDNQRMWIVMKLTHGKHSAHRRRQTVRDKVAYMITCPYCSSAYVSLAGIVLVDHWVSVPLVWLEWLAVWAGSLVVWRIVEDN